MRQSGAVFVNEGEKAHDICFGSTVAGFYKGKWVSEVPEQDDGQVLQLELQASQDLVIYNGRAVPIGDIIQQKRLTVQADEARVCYHEITDTPSQSDTKAFTLKKVQEVFSH